ncbi:MAG: 23S rRNA (pseudouridine(1915)-N(3))-methyltransferase RlmH [Clostridia bacterium]|nr:23S rRNA (pseudouridine(1915)-N(3))-methyltransferase RlmH [Clostridia bacterium]MBR5767381.1 23S rRNA (pseudouridine(1915)-N(3))-methyltransferase RlmH [Clostridia bacterium]
MLNVNILCVGDLRPGYIREAAEEYAKRIGAFACLRTIEVARERDLIPRMPKKGYRIALCVEGKQMTSEGFAKFVEDLPGRGYSDLTFVIGDSDGMGEDVKSLCDLRLSFSEMTFPHQLMRVILLEQIYRAFSIINHGKYHK